MGILSKTVSITRYRVEGSITEPVVETIYTGLKKNTIIDIDSGSAEKAVGWTSFNNPYSPDFSGASFVYGTYFVFSLRIDKKIVPPKIIKKHVTLETEKRMSQTGRGYLSQNEKKMVKDHVLNMLSLRIPSTPNVYDLIWNYEAGWIYFFSNLKSANEDLETIFIKSFDLNPIRIFPYTAATFSDSMSGSERDFFSKLTPTVFAS